MKQFQFFSSLQNWLLKQMRTVIEIIRIGILIKEPEEIKVWIGTKLLIVIK